VSGRPASDDDRDRGEGDHFDRVAFARASEAARIAAARLSPRALHTLAREVVTRLAVRARSDLLSAGTAPPERIERLCDAFLSPDDEAAPRMVAALRGAGVPVETIYLGYLAPVAERLGELWEEDRASFLDVTLAIARIYALLRGLRGALMQARRPTRLSALFAPVPGEQHTLGITMAADLLRARGWEITLKLGLDHDALVEAIARSEHPVIGLTAAGQASLVQLTRLLVAIRVARPEALILLGGGVARADDGTRPLLDVDALAPDVATAERELERLRGILLARG
jgi:methanogenic corrinoid protein MtbC1